MVVLIQVEIFHDTRSFVVLPPACDTGINHRAQKNSFYTQHTSLTISTTNRPGNLLPRGERNHPISLLDHRPQTHTIRLTTPQFPSAHTYIRPGTQWKAWMDGA